MVLQSKMCISALLLPGFCVSNGEEESVPCGAFFALKEIPVEKLQWMNGSWCSMGQHERLCREMLINIQSTKWSVTITLV